jgi:hypothetical protein
MRWGVELYMKRWQDYARSLRPQTG